MTVILPVSALHCEDASGETSAVLKIVLQADFKYDTDGRANLLHAVSVYCSATMASLPTNTPQEQEWVNNEGHTRDSNKIARLVNTPEWGRYQLGTIYRGCLDATEKIAVAQKASDKIAEAAYWTSLSITFNDSHDMQIYAKNAAVDLKRHGIYFMNAFRRGMMIAALRTIEEIR
jgi:hypothetical protein